MPSSSLEAWRAAGRAFDWRGHRIFYRDHGSGNRALLLIHGFPTASWDWAKLWEPLTQRFARVIAADMIGYGFSDKPAGYDYTIFDQADLQQGLLAQLGVARVHVLAHDVGDTVAQELLARELEGKAALDSCVLLNGGLFIEAQHPRLIQKLLLGPLGPLLGRLMNRRSFGRSFSAILGRDTQPTREELDDFWALIRTHDGTAVMHRLIRYLHERRRHRERWVGALQKTRVPLRLINGPDDPVSGRDIIARYRELIPNPDVVELPGIGHYPQVEDPGGVLQAFDAFHKSPKLPGPARVAPTGPWTSTPTT